MFSVSKFCAVHSSSHTCYTTVQKQIVSSGCNHRRFLLLPMSHCR